MNKKDTRMEMMFYLLFDTELANSSGQSVLPEDNYFAQNTHRAAILKCSIAFYVHKSQSRY